MADDERLEDRVVYINRVSKAVSGGSTFSFSTMVAVGNTDGKVGIGIGRDEEVPGSIEKGRTDAEKELHKIPRAGSTIPHEIEMVHDSARVLLKPAAPGTGVIAGGAVRAITELAGIEDILTKSLGSDNPLNIARATLKGLRNLKDPHKVAQNRGVDVEQILADHPYAGPDDIDAEMDVEDDEETDTDDEETTEETEETETVEEELKEHAESDESSDEEEEDVEEVAQS